MAWRSSGTNNAEMVDKLKQYGVITSKHVEEGFRKVDRKFFVPAGNESIAHSDQPLKEGNVHISAPHIYGSAVEALNLVPNSSSSFLNIGSGTGYISCIAAEILGSNSLNYGVELHDDVIQHSKASIAKWRTNMIEEKDGVSTIHFLDDTADMQIVKGNGLSILKTRGESVVGFDRIYIGAAVDKEDLDVIIKLLSPGGVLVGPVEDELVKVVRVGSISLDLEGDITMETEDGGSSLAGMAGGEFTSQILSGVRFAPLSASLIKNTVIPAKVWNPLVQSGYSTEFKRASMQLLLSANSALIQPLPRQPSQGRRFNVAAMLPKTIWLEILSFTHRKWFAPEQNEADYLRRRLREEKAKVANAERMRREAEERCLAVERERAVYRLLARRWQSRLSTLLQQLPLHENVRQQDEAAEDLFEIFGVAGAALNNHDNEITQPDNRGTLLDLRAVLQELNGGTSNNEDRVNDSDEDANISADEEPAMDLEENDLEEEDSQHDLNNEEDGLLEFLEDGHNSDSDNDVLSVDSDNENDSVLMEDVNPVTAKSERGADQPRTISVSSDDL